MRDKPLPRQALLTPDLKLPGPDPLPLESLLGHQLHEHLAPPTLGQNPTVNFDAEAHHIRKPCFRLGLRSQQRHLGAFNVNFEVAEVLHVVLLEQVWDTAASLQ